MRHRIRNSYSLSNGSVYHFIVPRLCDALQRPFPPIYRDSHLFGTGKESGRIGYQERPEARSGMYCSIGTRKKHAISIVHAYHDHESSERNAARSLLLLHRLEDMSDQTVLAGFLHPDKVVPEDLRNHLGPQEPIDETDAEDRPTSDSMSPVWQSLVWLAAWRGLRERHDEEEDVGGSKEGSGADGEGAWSFPVRSGAELEVNDTEGDDGVDD